MLNPSVSQSTLQRDDIFRMCTAADVM